MTRPAAAGEARRLRELFAAILELKGLSECEEFFADLCTPGELSAMSGRWMAARLLDRGLPYRLIYEKTGVSTATVTRVARCFFRAGGGYRRVLDRLGGR